MKVMNGRLGQMMWPPRRRMRLRTPNGDGKKMKRAGQTGWWVDTETGARAWFSAGELVPQSYVWQYTKPGTKPPAPSKPATGTGKKAGRTGWWINVSTGDRRWFNKGDLVPTGFVWVYTKPGTAPQPPADDGGSVDERLHRTVYYPEDTFPVAR